MPKINVLLANDHLGIGKSIHGVGRLFSVLVPRFDRNKFNITVCVLRKKDWIGDEFDKDCEKLGVKVRFFGRRKFDPFTLIDFIKVIREEKIDVMHLQAYGASTFGRLAGIITGVPTIVHAHDDDSNYPWYQRIADLILSRSTDKAIAVSESVKESSVRKRKICEDRVVVMHNGIPLEKFRMPESDEIEKEKGRLGISLNSKVVGTVARLRKEKGIEYLLKSVPKVLAVFPNTIFLIVGDGPLRGELESLSRRLRIDQNVIFTGYQEDVPKILSIFDIKVLPSLTEGFGLVIVEAMAMGKPIIATNVGGTKEILKDGETGLLVPSKDPKILSEKIIYLLSNEGEAKRLGMKAKEESKKYDINLYVRRLEEQYSELVSSRQ
jgi:glycosyltransferase involved in cell wall biosynthesis